MSQLPSNEGDSDMPADVDIVDDAAEADEGDETLVVDEEDVHHVPHEESPIAGRTCRRPSWEAEVPADQHHVDHHLKKPTLVCVTGDSDMPAGVDNVDEVAVDDVDETIVVDEDDVHDVPHDESPISGRMQRRRSWEADIPADRHLHDFSSSQRAEPQLRSPSANVGSIGKLDAVWFELTESFDTDAVDDGSFGLDIGDFRRIELQFGKDETIPNTLKYELTEDLRAGDGIWDDDAFGFSDEQLQTLWKRFGMGMAHKCHTVPSSSLGIGSSVATSTPAHKTLQTTAEDTDLPSADVLQTVEDFIGGDTSIEDFIGEPVPDLRDVPHAGMRASMVSTHDFYGESWYLFKVEPGLGSANRFYMKSFGDFEELHSELQKVSPGGRKKSGLPMLQSRDMFGFQRLWGGRDFDYKRAENLKSYVHDLMSRGLTPAQEQVIRLFFGPNARGLIEPPMDCVTRPATPEVTPRQNDGPDLEMNFDRQSSPSYLKQPAMGANHLIAA